MVDARAEPVVYRNSRDNAAVATVSAFAAVLPVLVIGANTGDPVISKLWLGAWAVAWAVVFAVRALRRGVTLDGTGATRRGLFVSWFAPWELVREVERMSDEACSLVRGGESEALELEGRTPPGAPTLADACQAHWLASRDHRVYVEKYLDRGWWRVAFVASAVAVVAGVPIWAHAVQQGDRYAERAAREQRGVAVVTDVRVEEDSDGEGNTKYTTRVEALLRLHGTRTVPIRIQRPGDHGGDYQEERTIPVVYDTAHVRDADFGDRPTRIDQDTDVRSEKTAGVFSLFGGLLGLVVVGAVMRHDWRQRLR